MEQSGWMWDQTFLANGPERRVFLTSNLNFFLSYGKEVDLWSIGVILYLIL